MSNFQQVSVSAIILNNKGEFLLLRRSENDAFLPKYWEIPGGAMEFGEEPNDSLAREILEECGLKVIIISPTSVVTYFMEEGGDKIQRVDIIFLTKLINEDSKVELSNEHSSYRWITFKDLHNFRVSDLMKKLIIEVHAHPLLNKIQ